MDVVPRYRHFGDYVGALAAHADRVALTRRTFISIERESYATLCANARRTSRFLASEGVVPGDRVFLAARNAPEWMELLLGTVLLGAVLVPFDATGGDDAIRRAARETRPTVAFCDEAAGRALVGLVPTYPLAELRLRTAVHEDVAPDVTLDGQMPAFIVFTSGTTADPKGVVLSHANVLANIEGIRARIAVDPGWRLLSVLPLSHTYELTGTLTVLAGGAQVVYLPQVTPALISRALVEFRITTILATPQFLTILFARVRQLATEGGRSHGLDRALRISGALPRPIRRIVFASVHRRLGGELDLVVTGGAPIPFEDAVAWEKMGVRTVQGYGLTETAPILTVNGLRHRRLDSPGRSLDNVELRIAADGEIQARGPNVFAGYWERDDATREAFTEDGWFRTGDAGSIEGGWLKIEGRLKFAIVRRSGLKVFPEDVELVADTIAVLRECCIVGAATPSGEGVTAVVRSDEPDEPVAAAVDELNTRLADFQHVDAWRRWPEAAFPRTRLGKIDRLAVREWVNHEPREVALPAAPTPLDPLSRIIRANLDDRSAAFDDDSELANIGLGSLGRLSVVAMVEEQLGISIPEHLVTPTTTVGALRSFLGAAPVAPVAPLRPRWPFNPAVRAVGTALRETVINGIVRMWVRVDVEGTERLELLTSPALYIFNHSDDFDGPVVWHALPRTVRRRLAAATASDVLADHRALAFLIRLCFAGFAFARTEPLMDSFEYVGELVDQGWSIAIAPEGQLSTDGQLHAFKPGIGVLAVNLGIPVVPVKTVGLSGTVPLHAKWPKRRSHPTVRIGEPLRFSADSDFRVVTEALQRAMEDL